MLERTKRRVTLLAGLSAAVLIGGSPASATPVIWGAIKSPADIIAPEPAKKAQKDSKKEKREKARKERAAQRQHAETAKPETPTAETPQAETAKAETTGQTYRGEPGTAEIGVRAARIITTRTADDTDDSSSTRSKKSKAEKKDKAAKPEPAEPVIPAGPLHVIVSVDTQRASLYANGTFVASTAVSTGTKSHPTPMGVFSVIQKNRHHVSNLYGAPMPYMQRLTWSGTAMHTGPLPGYPASHGCIRLTNDFAVMLWKATRIGARVIVTRDDVKPVEISHARLIAPAAPAMAMPVSGKQTEITGALVRTADATATMTTPDAARPADTFKPIIRDVLIEPPARAPNSIERKQSPVSIFISRKDARLYVRQAMQPLFDLPLTLREPAEPLGTHVYTAMEVKDGAMRWTLVSIPSSFPREIARPEKFERSGRKTRPEVVVPIVQAPLPSASAALDRIDLPPEAIERLAGLIMPGSSLIISDNALSGETGKYTDFIILTR